MSKGSKGGGPSWVIADHDHGHSEPGGVTPSTLWSVGGIRSMSKNWATTHYCSVWNAPEGEEFDTRAVHAWALKKNRLALPSARPPPSGFPCGNLRRGTTADSRGWNTEISTLLAEEPVTHYYIIQNSAFSSWWGFFMNTTWGDSHPAKMTVSNIRRNRELHVKRVFGSI